MHSAAPTRHRRLPQRRSTPETPPEPPAGSGIDYLRLVGDAHHAELADRVNYAALAGDEPASTPTTTPDPEDTQQ
jgi:hypothetical protein